MSTSAATSISTSLNRLSLLFLAVIIFCATMIESPDATLLSANAELKVPYLDSTIRLSSFLLFGPVALIVAFVYLHILFEQFDQLPASEKLSVEFTWLRIDNMTMRLFRNMLFYFATPCLLIIFAWKAMPRPEYQYLGFLSIATITASGLLYLWRRNNRPSIKPYIQIWLSIALLSALLMFFTGGALIENVMAQRKFDLMRIDLENSDLSDVRLPNAVIEDANLERADLQRANLVGADLTSADLTDANLRAADLSGAVLTKAKFHGALLERRKIGETWTRVSLRDAVIKDAEFSTALMGYVDLAGAAMHRTKLIGADLTRAKLAPDTVLVHVEANGAKFFGADMTAVDIHLGHFEQAIFVGADMTNAFLSRSSFISSQFSNAKLNGATLTSVDLRFAKFVNTNLSGATIENSVLSSAKLVEATLVGATFNKVNLTGADLTKAILTKAVLVQVKVGGGGLDSAVLAESDTMEAPGFAPNSASSQIDTAQSEGAMAVDIDPTLLRLAGADLRGATITDSTLIFADFKGANLRDATFHKVDLTAADLTDADLRGVEGLSCADIMKAKNWRRSKRDGDLAAC